MNLFISVKNEIVFIELITILRDLNSYILVCLISTHLLCKSTCGFSCDCHAHCTGQFDLVVHVTGPTQKCYYMPLIVSPLPSIKSLHNIFNYSPPASVISHQAMMAPFDESHAV